MRSLHTRTPEILAAASIVNNCSDEAETGDHFVYDQLHKTRHLAHQLARVIHRDQQLHHVQASQLSNNERVAAKASTGLVTAIL